MCFNLTAVPQVTVDPHSLTAVAGCGSTLLPGQHLDQIAVQAEGYLGLTAYSPPPLFLGVCKNSFTLTQRLEHLGLMLDTNTFSMSLSPDRW